MSEKNQGCPFCGSQNVASEALQFSTYFISCNSCGAEGPPAGGLKTAWEAWNRRHQEQDQSSTFERMMSK